jgi:ATP-dependent helicase/nuclease subunit A
MTVASARLPDQADRELVRNVLDETVVVEAAAGTGKTTELVLRILNVLAQGRARIDEIVAVTFTEKAAGELKLRIRKELENLRHRSAEASARDNLTAAIQRLEEAHVSTIHGFCADLLRERPVEAGVDPLFDVLTEARADRLYDEAFRGWLHEQLESPPEGVRRALRRSAWSRDGRDSDEGPIDRFAAAGRSLVEWRDFAGAWGRESFDRAGELRTVIDAVHELAALTGRASSTRDLLYLDTKILREFSHDLRTASRFDAPDLDSLEARVVDLAQNRDLRRARRGRDRLYGPELPRDVVWTAYEALIAELDRFQHAADCDLAALLHGELREVVERYEQLKRRAGALDFVDLLLRARDLLVGHESVRRAFQSRFTHLFVDEFQDTDPLQAEILLLLSADDPAERHWRQVSPIPGKLFIVGDPKQAIYRFRRADVETYQDVCDLLVAKGARRAFLHTSFRSTPAIQRAVNAAFAPLMKGDRATLQADYVALTPYRPDTEQPSVVALPVPEPYGQRRVAGYAIEKSQPGGVAAFVHWLLTESGWTVSERTARDELPLPVPVQPRHVCILFRRFLHFGEDVTRPYVEALEARGVPHLLVGGKSFHDREEVDTMRAALAAVEWPDDELSVFATLRGALFAIDDEALLEYYAAHGPLHPFRIPERVAPPLEAIVRALTLLRQLHGRRNYVPVADTVTRLLDATRAHVGFVLRSAGEQALANVLHIAELARQYEANGGLSFRGFVEELQAQADGGQAAEAPVLEEGADGVRLMTVHKAKGLEFPIVVLADMTAKLRNERADRSIDRGRNTCYQRLGRWLPKELVANEAWEVARDEAEGVRLAYVAATRARDLLVVPAVGDVEWDGGWTGPLNAAIYPPPLERRVAASAPGCPAFKKDSVWKRPDDDPATPFTVAPGLHIMPGSGETSFPVVWWDPHALELNVELPPGIRRETLIMKDVPESVVAEGLRDYERWRESREEAIASGSRPSVAVRTATEWAERQAAFPDAASAARWQASTTRSEAAPSGGVGGDRASAPLQRDLFGELHGGDSALPPIHGQPRVDLVDIGGAVDQRAAGTRYGELVHAALATVPLDADAAVVAGHTEVHGRILKATAVEVAAAAGAVSRVLAHPLLGRARAAMSRGTCRRETPVTITLEDTLIEGIVDLAFEEDGAWVVIDYKTDRELDTERGTQTRYRQQLGLYVSAIGQATGRQTVGVLVRV